MLTATIIQHINMYSPHQVMIPIRLKNVKMRSQFWELAQSNLSKEKRLVPLKKTNNKNKKKNTYQFRYRQRNWFPAWLKFGHTVNVFEEGVVSSGLVWATFALFLLKKSRYRRANINKQLDAYILSRTNFIPPPEKSNLSIFFRYKIIKICFFSGYKLNFLYRNVAKLHYIYNYNCIISFDHLLE